MQNCANMRAQNNVGFSPKNKSHDQNKAKKICENEYEWKMLEMMKHLVRKGERGNDIGKERDNDIGIERRNKRDEGWTQKNEAQETYKRRDATM